MGFDAETGQQNDENKRLATTAATTNTTTLAWLSSFGPSSPCVASIPCVIHEGTDFGGPIHPGHTARSFVEAHQTIRTTATQTCATMTALAKAS